MASNRQLPGDLTVTGMDQKSIYQWMANVTDLLNEMQTDHGTNNTLVNSIRTHLTGDRLYSGDPAMILGTSFDIKTGANPCIVSIDGSLGTVAAAAACDTGTSADLPQGKWGVFNVTSTVGGSLTATWDTNATVGYASEAGAIAALPAAPSSQASIGYVTVQANATANFLAGTDGLQGSTAAGIAAQATNYYTVVDPLGVIGSAGSALSNSTAITLLRS